MDLHPAPPASPASTETAALSDGAVGMWIFLVTDAMSFAGLLFAYGVLRGGAGAWRRAPFDIPFSTGLTLLLAATSLTMALGRDAARRGHTRALGLSLGATVVGGLGFVAGQAYEWRALVRHGFVPAADRAAATFFAVTGFHGLHVVAGVLLLGVAAARALAGRAPSAARVGTLALFWHFVDALWVVIFTALYLV